MCDKQLVYICEIFMYLRKAFGMQMLELVSYMSAIFFKFIE